MRFLGPPEESGVYEFRHCSSDEKFNPLGYADIEPAPDNELLAFLVEDRTAKAVEPKNYRVLDFGCGRGTTVGRLRKRGWQAFGVDVDPHFVGAGELVNRMAIAPFPILSVLDDNGRSMFPDNYFDSVISDQTIEHVADISTVSREIARTLKPGGVTLHRYPAKYMIVEGHYRLPLVHWLPKNRVRYFAIRVLLGLGFSGRMPISIPKRKAALAVYRYSCDHTFYRSRATTAAAFAESGIRLDFRTFLHSRAVGKLKRLGLPPPLALAIASVPGPIWVYNTFVRCLPVGRKSLADRQT